MSTPQTSSDKRPGLFLALVPWVLFSFLANHGSVQIATVAALIASAVIAVPGVRAGSPKTLELSAVAAFAGLALLSLDPAAANFIARYGRGVAAGLLSLIAFGSLLFMIAGSIDTQRSNLIFNWVLPVLLVVWGIKRSTPGETITSTPAHA